ncbi:hypothetical protein [Falsibacillus albus]|nr:hypothetical protein [Falsibacillus albus]
MVLVFSIVALFLIFFMKFWMDKKKGMEKNGEQEDVYSENKSTSPKEFQC